MRYVEAPERYLPTGDERSIFLAGGITGCPDWQRTASDLMRDHEVVVFNPRRGAYPPATADILAEQIAWEYHHLQLQLVHALPEPTLHVTPRDTVDAVLRTLTAGPRSV